MCLVACIETLCITQLLVPQSAVLQRCIKCGMLTSNVYQKCWQYGKWRFSAQCVAGISKALLFQRQRPSVHVDSPHPSTLSVCQHSETGGIDGLPHLMTNLNHRTRRSVCDISNVYCYLNKTNRVCCWQKWTVIHILLCNLAILCTGIHCRTGANRIVILMNYLKVQSHVLMMNWT